MIVLNSTFLRGTIYYEELHPRGRGSFLLAGIGEAGEVGGRGNPERGPRDESKAIL